MPISTSQRYSSVKSMMRFSMTLLACHGGFQELRFKDKASAHYDFLAQLESIEYQCLASRSLTGSHRTNRETIGSRSHEDNALTIDLLDGVGRHEQYRLALADGYFSVGQHFRAEP